MAQSLELGSYIILFEMMGRILCEWHNKKNPPKAFRNGGYSQKWIVFIFLGTRKIGSAKGVNFNAQNAHLQNVQ